MSQIVESSVNDGAKLVAGTQWLNLHLLISTEISVTLASVWDSLIIRKLTVFVSKRRKFIDE